MFMDNLKEETGHFDSNNNWIKESVQAKLRNKLTPFWTLSSIISDDRRDILSNEELKEFLIKLSDRCESLKVEITELINESEISYQNILKDNSELYSEQEVEDLLEIQRGNSYVSVLNNTKDINIASLASLAPEPGGGSWKKSKIKK
jgi:hypothetical protein